MPEATLEVEQPLNTGDNPAEEWAQFLISFLLMRGVLTLDEVKNKGKDFRKVLADGLNVAAQSGSGFDDFEDFRRMRDYAEHAEVWRERAERCLD